MLFSVVSRGSAGWVSWPARNWREARTPPSLWNGLEQSGFATSQYTVLIRAGCCQRCAGVGVAGGVHVVHETVCQPTYRWLGPNRWIDSCRVG